MKDLLPPYWIVSGVVILAGIVTVIYAYQGIVSKVTTSQEEVKDERSEDPWSNIEMILYFLTVMGIFLCACCMDTIFSSYLYIYGMCR